MTVSRKYPSLGNPEVLVVGGGPAGIGAALGAARKGAQVLLIENHGFFGGVAAYGLGMPINQMRPGGTPRSDVHELVIQNLLHYGDLAVKIGDHQLWCNVEYLKAAVLDALDDVDCRYLLHTRAVDSIVEDNRITGVLVSTKEGLHKISAKIVIDCSGDGDVAYFAGAETMKATGSLSPMTLLFNVTNVDIEQAQRVNISAIVEHARKKYPLIPVRWRLSTFPSSTCCYINHFGTRDIGQFDGTDPEQLTKAERISRRQVLQMVQAMREYGGEALEDIEIIATGPQIGVCETRRVRGVYVLTEDDALSGRSFDDAVAWRSGFLDIGGGIRLSKMKIHDVPYRAIIPKTLDGLLMAGRCISASHVAASAGKSMGNCMATGHAAGLAATLSIKQGCLPRELSVQELQTALRADGVDLTRSGDDQHQLDPWRDWKEIAKYQEV